MRLHLHAHSYMFIRWAGIHVEVAVQYAVMFCATADSRLSMQPLLSQVAISLSISDETGCIQRTHYD